MNWSVISAIWNPIERDDHRKKMFGALAKQRNNANLPDPAVRLVNDVMLKLTPQSVLREPDSELGRAALNVGVGRIPPRHLMRILETSNSRGDCQTALRYHVAKCLRSRGGPGQLADGEGSHGLLVLTAAHLGFKPSLDRPSSREIRLGLKANSGSWDRRYVDTLCLVLSRPDCDAELYKDAHTLFFEGLHHPAELVRVTVIQESTQWHATLPTAVIDGLSRRAFDASSHVRRTLYTGLAVTIGRQTNATAQGTILSSISRAWLLLRSQPQTEYSNLFPCGNVLVGLATTAIEHLEVPDLKNFRGLVDCYLRSELEKSRRCMQYLRVLSNSAIISRERSVAELLLESLKHGVAAGIDIASESIGTARGS